MDPVLPQFEETHQPEWVPTEAADSQQLINLEIFDMQVRKTHFKVGSETDELRQHS